MSPETKILVVDDDQNILTITTRILESAGYRVIQASTGKECIEKTMAYHPDLILLDVVLPDMNGTEVCKQIKADPRLQNPFIVLASGERTSSDHQAEGLDVGADGYIGRPISNRELLARVQSMVRIKQAEDALQRAHDELEIRVAQRTEELARANLELRKEIDNRKRAEKDLQKALAEIEQLRDRLQTENIYLREEIKLEHNFEEIIGESHAITYLLYKVEQVAPTDATVLILGETGTGKELVARAIHHASNRRKRPLVKVNCATLPANLIESELFGHEKGAFTGAQSKQPGRFDLADGGTIFLDEIGEVPLELQAKLLRVLQDGEFERLGSAQTIRVDVRIIAATNRKLKEEVKRGRFREDLWYRLNVFPITVPPLRQRREDVPLLVNSFVKKFTKKMGKEILEIPPDTMRTLQSYAWPGNVRELENVIERAVIVSQGRVLLVEPPITEEIPDRESRTLEDLEREHIIRVLKDTHWKIEGKDGAAQVLGLNSGTLRSRMKKLGIERPSL